MIWNITAAHAQGLVTLLQYDAVTNLLANGSAAFI